MPILTQTARRILGSCAGLLTQDCLLCGASSGASLICSACEADLPQLPVRLCPRCALPTPAGEICGRCLAKPPHYDLTLAALRYDFPLDKLVQSFKYGHRLALAGYFGRRLAALLVGLPAELIVPMPLHPLRLRARGFNQALELARPVSKAWRIPIDRQSCQRIRHTPAQADLPWRERAANIRGAFQCSADFTGKRLLLIDDVMTTGASLDELARVVRLHGAEQVTLLVLARALAPA
ncbi:MAG: DNA utilization protein GntX [Candidatus Accumulibacter appositus]|uniref:DNA utilization protein GntX n=2 Tax=Candidatus Accumulibacter TaxID=327159 RepID=A0A011PQA1_9PROT|nr:MAG: DNA utilization protein GntX [Candidatus Accumulibacter appositus]HRF03199.1 ComF family protein [Accumulibacter sp.]